MLAARLLGERQFGLSALVEHFLGVKLDKGSQKADWAQRPLTEKMEIYARNDTHHLKPLADKLESALKAKGRLAWHQESCARLIEDCSRPAAVDTDAVWRVKGSSILNRPALAILRELWQWREKEAIAYCRPPFFVLSHERMVDIADAAAAQQPFDQILPPKMSPRRREAFIGIRQSRAGRSHRRASRNITAMNSAGQTRRNFAASVKSKSTATPTPTNWPLTRRSSPARRSSAIWRAIGIKRTGIDELAAGVVEITCNYRTFSNAKPFKYSVSGIIGMIG